jgi:hypothetical protein
VSELSKPNKNQNMKTHQISKGFSVLAIMFSLILPGECLAGGFNGQAAYNYAATYWDAAVSDGYYWIEDANLNQYCHYFGSGTSVSAVQNYINTYYPNGAGVDCAHFVSSCIGLGGGLSVPPQAQGQSYYGYAYAPSLVSWLISSGSGVVENSESALQVGDVIGYNWNGNSSIGSIDHVALYIGNGQIAAHSSSHWGYAWNAYAASYPNVRYTFIHILTSNPTISVTVQPSISGRSFTVDGNTYTTAQTFNWVPGNSHTIATTTPQSGGTGIQYVWSSWSDSGAMSHIVAPTVATTYTANFTTQYYLIEGYGTGGSSVSPGTGWYNSGASFSVSATPASGYSFSSWTGSGTGSYSGSSASPTITMNGPISEMANFTANPVTISVTVQPSLSGRSFTVDGSTYTTAQTFNWVPGNSHTIATTTPQSGGTGIQYVWSSWSDSGAMSHIVAPTVATTYTANFTTQYYLIEGYGTGGSSVSPGTGWYNSGASFSVSATPASGYSFSSWTGSGTGSYSGSSASPTITMNGPISEMANFTANPVTISVTVQPSLSGRSFTVDGSTYTTAQTFSWVPGNSHTIATTSPQSGGTGIQYVWSSWSDSGAISHTVAPTVATTYTANFTTQYLLTTGYGTGGSSVSPGSGYYNSGASVSVSETPASGYSFSSWTGSGTGSYSGSSASPTITMNAPITELANFVLIPDTTPPTVSITAPVAGQHMTNALATFVGKASDNLKVASVWYQVNSSAWNLVTTTTNSYTNWTQTVTLNAGSNTFKTYARDFAGNSSTTQSLSVLSSNTFKLQLAFTNALPLKTNGLVFTLQLSTGLNGHIQVSTNLISWATLTNFVGTNSTLIFRDPAATNSPRRYYRAVIP